MKVQSTNESTKKVQFLRKLQLNTTVQIEIFLLTPKSLSKRKIANSISVILHKILFLFQCLALYLMLNSYFKYCIH